MVKKNFKRVLSILLCMIMILSTLPMSVFAAEGEETKGPTTNGSYVNGVWTEGGNGSASYNIDGTDVTLSKTATPVANMENTFDITLQVTTSTTTSYVTDAGAVVLVIDTSKSMNGAKITAAKTAALNFLKAYAGTDEKATRMLAIVDFNESGTVRLNWSNVAGGDGKNSYDTAEKTINDLGLKTGTNMQDGLLKAKGLLAEDSLKSYQKSVVLLSDGDPTRSNEGSGNDHEGNAAKAATEVKNTGATVYTIGFQTNSSTNSFLANSIASANCAYTASDADELNEVFKAIAEKVEEGLSGDGWTATDPMADMISVTGGVVVDKFYKSGEDTYTWKLANAEVTTSGNVTTYTYTYTYRVELDVQGENFEEGRFFPTNEATYLNVDGQQYAFPVPGVQGKLPRTDVSVTKVWNDENNQDGIRPTSVTVRLKNEKGDVIGGDVVLNADNGWTYTWNGEEHNLIAKSKGVEHKYTVEEDQVTDYEKPVVTKDGFKFTVTNTHNVYKKDITVTKVWDDKNNQDGIRPASVTVNLLADREVVATAELNEANGWRYTFAGFDVYKAGTAIVYTVEETNVPEGYIASVNGLTITNTHKVEKTEVPVTKVWNDADNQDGIRPNDVTVKLLANGTETGKTLVLNPGNKWTGSFTDLDKYENGVEIVYTVAELKVDGYDTVITGDQKAGFTITNSHTPATVEVSGSKTWVDNNNQDGFRPESITVHLLKNGEVIDTKVVAEADGWAWSFENLPKYENHGTLINYSIKEDVVEDYSTVINGYNITNTHTPEQTSVTVTKSWKDNNDQDGIQPEYITVELVANGEATGKTLVLNAGNGWTGSFTELDKYENGQVIKYTVAEIAVEGYNTVITGDQNTGYTITNSHTPAVVEVAGSKTWDDNNNQDGFRPESITINLLADGEIIDTITVTEADNWTWSFENLPKYKDQGTLIVYTITENAIDDYSTTYNGFNVTNKHTPEQTSVTVSKSWVDNDDQDGIRPNDITVELVANGEATGKTLVLNAGNGWTGSFTELDVYKAGKVIAYTVEEIAVDGYNTVITGDQTEGYTITNSHTPATVEVSGAKTWADNKNQDGKRPASITINLLADGVVIDTVTVTEADNWSWSFKNLPEYRDHGTRIIYTVTENAVDEYVTEINGYNVTNTHAPEKTSVTVVKSWLDNNDQDGIQPEYITVELVANGEATGNTLTLSEGNNWTGSFTDLDKYAGGKVIDYTVAEISVPGYETVISGSQQNGYTITNTHTPETVEVSGSKTWNDNNNQDGKRPENITINLLKNGEVIDTKVVTEKDGWAWSFDNLPKYENHGTVINYSITEVAVEEYTTTYNGYNVTNTHAPEKTSVTVTKSWKDNNDQDGIRPNGITVVLVANGEATESTLVLNEGNNWTDSFTDLDKYEGGKVVAYTVAEVEVEGYASVITGSHAEGYTITNSHNPAVVEVSGSKTWDDNNNQDGKRPASITINLLKNGKVIDTKVVTAEEDWAWSFTNLPKFENHGTLITYSITENVVDEYTTVINGYNVTNTHAPEKTSVTVSKGWEDNNDQDGIRPNDITVVLVANGEATESTLVLNDGNNWTDSFTDLDKYEGGEVVAYTVAEVEVEGYTSVITGSHAEGYTITNSHTPEVVAVEGSKTWVDADNQDGFRPESITINLLADGEVINTVEVTEADGWAWSFENLPKYKDHGTEIVYGVTEVAVDKYVTEYDGYNVTNTHAPEKVSVTVSKAWDDNNDQDGIRPEEITVILLANGEASDKTLALTAEGNWIGSFTDLDKYENGVEIVYTVAELNVDGYDTVITGDQKVGYTITNSHEPEKTVVAGKKTWDDNNNQDGKRPEVIEINVFGNGVLLETVKVTEAEGWAWSFNLPKYVNGGKEVAYAITENSVEGYTATYEGYNVTNSYTPEETGFTVSKVWADSDDADGIRPDEVEIKLFANGEDTGIVLVLNEETKWVGSINGLPKYWEGEEIEYTVEEVAVKGYNTVIKGTVEEGFTVTNSHVVIPDTGDNRNPVLWISLMAGAVLTAGVALFTKKRKTAK